MIQEDYVGFEVAKLLKKKGFDEATIGYYYTISETPEKIKFFDSPISIYHSDGLIGCIHAPTIQMAMKWLREVHNVLIIPDYDYECTDKSYCYKIYKLGENGKPERVPIEGVRYDMLGEPHTEIVAYRDYKRSYFDYETYEEAAEAGIKYCLENLI